MTTDHVNSISFMLAHGQFDSRIKSGEDYDTITINQIWRMCKDPQCKPKGEADFIIPSTYHSHDARSHDAQRQHGQFHMLCIDVDEGNPSKDDVTQAVANTLGRVAMIIYSSSSATKDNRKWRALIPLKRPLAGEEYGRYQALLFEALGECGITCDFALARTGQPIFLPNVPASKRDASGLPEFYEYGAVKGDRLNLDEHLISIAVKAQKEEEAKIKAEADAARQKRAEERAAKRAANPQQCDPVDEFNARHTVSDMLSEYGYTQLGASEQWHSPNQSTKSYPVRDFGDHWVSMSGSDMSAGIGMQKDFYCWGDAFDLFVHYEHAGDFTAAVREYGQEVNPSKPTASQVLKDAYDFPQYDDAPQSADQSTDEGANEGGPTMLTPDTRQVDLHRIFTLSDARPVLKSSYLIKGWLGKSQMSVVYGPSNVGKSFFCLDMAFSIAANAEWNGSRVRGGTVLYLATEGGNAFRNRVYALRQSKGVDDAPLLVRPSPIDLLRAEVDMPALMALCDEVKGEHGNISMIVVDTLSRAMAGGNENGPEDMTRLIGNLDTLRDLTDAHIMVVHHSGKDTAAGARGHSSLRAATDTEIELEVDESGMRIAKTTKQRDMEPKPPFGFTLKVHDLGKDEDGDAVTTCTILPASEEELAEAKQKKPAGNNQRLVLECFKQLRGEGSGMPNPGGVGWPESGTRWCISEEVLKDHVMGKMTDKSNPRSSYANAIKALIMGGHMERNAGFLWRLGKEGKIV